MASRWLAGRGYNVLGVCFPVNFNGEKDHVSGDLLAVLWENTVPQALLKQFGLKDLSDQRILR